MPGCERQGTGRTVEQMIEFCSLHFDAIDATLQAELVYQTVGRRCPGQCNAIAGRSQGKRQLAGVGKAEPGVVKLVNVSCLQPLQPVCAMGRNLNQPVVQNFVRRANGRSDIGPRYGIDMFGWRLGDFEPEDIMELDSLEHDPLLAFLSGS